MNIYIALCGTHSVGKTTTIEEAIPLLSEIFGDSIYYISEVSRKIKQKYGVSLNKEATSKTQRLIEQAYKDEEDANADKIIITDRTIIDRFAYTLLGDAVEDEDLVEWYKDNIQDVCKRYTYIFYVPLTNELKLEVDGVRDQDEKYRRDVDLVQKETIRAYDIPVHELRGSTAERLATIKSVILNSRKLNGV